MSWRVAISSTNYQPKLRSFAIEPEHPLIAHWPALRQDLLSGLDQSTIQWSALDVFRRRRSVEPTSEDDTTIVVTATRRDDRDWDELQERLRSICLKHGQLSLRIELVNGSISRFGSINELPYTTRPPIGSSLSVVGLDWASGTFGGYVTLRRLQEQWTCALTCHHVLRPTRKPGTVILQEGDQAYDPILNEEGKVHPAVTKPDRGLGIQQPSLMDYIEAKEWLKETLKTFNKRKTRIEEELAIGMTSRSKEQSLETTNNTIAIYMAMEAEMSNFNSYLGHVWATSGYKIAESKCALDWGLVCMDQARVGSNTIPRLPTLPSNYSIVEGDVVDEVGGMQHGDYVIAFGKKSGVRVGRFNSIDSDVHWPEHPQHKTTEYVVAGLDGEIFANKGDSGAFVLTSEGKLAGMVIGGPDPAGGPGYVTPITEVWRDIGAQTECNIELPS